GARRVVGELPRLQRRRSEASEPRAVRRFVGVGLLEGFRRYAWVPLSREISRSRVICVFRNDLPFPVPSRVVVGDLGKALFGAAFGDGVAEVEGTAACRGWCVVAFTFERVAFDSC